MNIFNIYKDKNIVHLHLTISVNSDIVLGCIFHLTINI